MDALHKEDLNILKQLYFGNHLESKELERAIVLIKLLEVGLKNRIKREV